MNSYEIDSAVARYCEHDLLGPATETLANLRDAVDANSDGWAYWRAPVAAARQLQTLIVGSLPDSRWDDERADVTAAAVRKAYAPLKAFRTRSKLQFEIVDIVS